MMFKKLKYIGVLALLSFSCGIKGPPLPPIEEETVQKQKVNETQAPAQQVSGDQTTIKKKNK